MLRTKRRTTTYSTSSLEVDGVPVTVLKKNTKHFYFRVYPPEGEIRVTAPRFATKGMTEAAIRQHLPWLRQKQEALQAREVVDIHYDEGSLHYLWGEAYPLRFVQGCRKHASLSDGHICIESPTPLAPDAVEPLLIAWYRERIKERIPDRIAYWEKQIGVESKGWRVRKMRSRWGSCHTRKHTISLNLELVKKPQECLDYVIVHELVHILERSHNKRFWGLVEQHYPNWKDIKKLLQEHPSGFF